MDFSVRCTCGKSFRVPEQHRGKRTKCRYCGGVLVLEPLQDEGYELASEPPSAPSQSASPAPARQLSPGTGRARSSPPLQSSRRSISSGYLSDQLAIFGYAKKIISVGIAIAIIYGAYVLLFAPQDITFRTYRRIAAGMSRSQVEAQFRAGRLRSVLKSVSDQMATRKDTIALSEGKDILLAEVTRESGPVVDSMRGIASGIYQKAVSQDLDSRQRGAMQTAIQGKITSYDGSIRAQYDEGGLTSGAIQRKIVSEQGTWDSDHTFVPAKSGMLTCSIRSKSGRGIGGRVSDNDVNVYGTIQFRDYQVDLKDARGLKAIMNGVVQVDGRSVPDQYQFESWMGSDNRLITVVFVGDRAICWLYKGPAEDFPATTSSAAPKH